MVSAIGKTITVAALCWAGAVCRIASGQVDGDIAGGEADAAAIEEEIVVRGRSPSELRFQIQIAEEAVLDRFNEINSDDRYDVVCRSEPVLGSRLDRRICRSNGWREEDANYAQATLQQMRGEAGPIAQQFLGEQQHVQQLLAKEMRRLVYEDEELYRAVERLGQAQLALAEHTGRRPGTVSRQVIPGENGLPYGAQLMFEVQMGRDAWGHRLTRRTFEVAHVTGRIRHLEVECDQGRERRKYEGESAWTLPPAWTACTLRVDAKRDTTFVLYEFE